MQTEAGSTGHKMARHWAPLQDPNKAETRSRSISRVGTTSDVWGQRPLFSEPGEDQLPPDQGNMGYEGRPDDIHPSDGRESSDAVASLVDNSPTAPVKFSVSMYNVSSPPTDAQLTEAFGNKAGGEAFIVNDNGLSSALWLVVRARDGSWHYEALTKAT